ncbi:UbiA prenyltransferase family [Halenospora varia]|nr:UbiA prenyltransferase family [Halenospora varia]
MKTFYLITKSDLKTTVLPATSFALAAALSGPLLTTTSTTPSLPVIFSRLPSAILWTWLNLFIFNLANQRLPDSILEDSINKPWRAIPSGRLSPPSAQRLILIAIPLTFFATLCLGGRNEHLILVLLTYMYNDLRGGDSHFLIRHILNALGFVSFGAGAAVVASSSPLNSTAYYWLGIVSLIITFTIQFQDMEDQEGDMLRERRTLPIVFGDKITRRLNAGIIVVFSVIAPAYWRMGCVGYAMPVLLGTTIGWRSMWLRKLKDDKTTFQLWCLWLIIFYLLPLVKVEGALASLWPTLD